jgi:hypothetical protein
MRTILYNEDEKILGYETADGGCEPLAPAPTGDALIELLDEVCTQIEHHPRLGKSSRLAANLRPANGQTSLLLMYGIQSPLFMSVDGTPNPDNRRFGGGVLAWITDGTLRSVAEVRNALNDYADVKEAQCRIRRIKPDWEFDEDSMWSLGARYFGLPAPPPLPTAEEIAVKAAAESERLRIAREEDARRAAEYEAERVAFEASPEGQRQKKVDQIVQDLLGPIKPPNAKMAVFMKRSLEEEERLKIADRAIAADELRPFVDEITKRTRYGASTIVKLWREAEQLYKLLMEVVEEGHMTIELADEEDFCASQCMREFAQMTPHGESSPGVDGPELKAGDSRRIFTPKEFFYQLKHKAAYWDMILQDHDLHYWMTRDRKFGVDIVAKSEEKEVANG